MTWYLWALVADLLVSALVKVAIVGVPRKSITPTEAVFAVVSAVLYAWAILHVGGVA